MEAIQNFINHLSKSFPLREEEKVRLKELISLKEVCKGEILLQEDEVCNDIYFVSKGCLRMFYLNDGQEKTTFFYEENMFVSSYESFTKRKRSPHNIDALENSQVICINRQTSESLMTFSQSFILLAKTMMEEELAILQTIISRFVIFNAEDRYKILLHEQPHLLQRIPQHILASYIGVSPETLSRIRKRLTNKK